MTPPMSVQSQSTHIQKLDEARIPGEPAMALIERDGKVYARKRWISLGPTEWGNELMSEVATEAFAGDPSLDAVQVSEHGGWYLTFLRDGTIVETANDQARFDDKAIEFLRSISGFDSAGEIRRQ
jgi:hypothetical protein